MIEEIEIKTDTITCIENKVNEMIRIINKQEAMIYELHVALYQSRLNKIIKE